jgi:succinoglycan biosynthesis protein ExoA
MRDYPQVSVVMPVRNENSLLVHSLGSVLSQDYPQERMEVIVVDGLSLDGTRETVRSLQSANPNLTLLSNERKIVSSGLNLAIRSAKGEAIIRIDGHCIIPKTYVRRCVELLTDRGDVECIGGSLRSVGRGAQGDAISLAMSTPFGVGDAYFRYSNREAFVDTVAFGAYRRRVFDNIGLFDEELVRNQDDEFNYRLRESGGKILLVPEIRAEYFTRSSFPRLWRQYFEYGYWKVRVMQKHPTQMQPRQFAPPTFVAALLFSLASIPFTSLGVWLLGLIGGSYAIANLFASVLKAHKNNWKSLLLLPVAFATLHLSYGAGFLVGLAKFWNRWGDREPRYASNPAQAEVIHPT